MLRAITDNLAETLFLYINSLGFLIPDNAEIVLFVTVSIDKNSLLVSLALML